MFWEARLMNDRTPTLAELLMLMKWFGILHGDTFVFVQAVATSDGKASILGPLIYGDNPEFQLGWFYLETADMTGLVRRYGNPSQLF